MSDGIGGVGRSNGNQENSSSGEVVVAEPVAEAVDGQGPVLKGELGIRISWPGREEPDAPDAWKLFGSYRSDIGKGGEQLGEESFVSPDRLFSRTPGLSSLMPRAMYAVFVSKDNCVETKFGKFCSEVQPGKGSSIFGTFKF